MIGQKALEIFENIVDGYQFSPEKITWFNLYDHIFILQQQTKRKTHSIVSNLTIKDLIAMYKTPIWSNSFTFGESIILYLEDIRSKVEADHWAMLPRASVYFYYPSWEHLSVILRCDDCHRPRNTVKRDKKVPAKRKKQHKLCHFCLQKLKICLCLGVCVI